MTMKQKTIIAISLCVLAVSCKKADKTDALTKEVNSNDTLMLSTENNAQDDAKLLKAAGAKEYNEAEFYTTDAMLNALLNAAKNNDIAEAQRLIEAGVDVNEMSDFGYTALMYAADDNAIELAQLLIKSGADMNARDGEGKTALLWAKEYDAADVAELLKAAGVKE